MAIKNIICKLTSSVKNSRVHEKAHISYFVRFFSSSIDAFSYVANNCNIFHASIGKYTSIGLGCNIGGGEHPLDWISTSPAFQEGSTFQYGFEGLPYKPYKQTVIGNDVFIAPGVIIKSGVRIADGAVIGSGAVVTKDVGPYEIWAGNPARCIRKRFPDETAEKLLELKWWDWPEEKIAKYARYFNQPDEFLRQCGENGELPG